MISYLFIIISILLGLDNDFDNPVIDFSIIEENDLISIEFSNQMYNDSIKHKFTELLNDGKYGAYFSSKTNPIKGKSNKGNIIRVEEIKSIRDYNSKEQDIFDFINESTYTMYFIPLLEAESAHHEFLKFMSIQENNLYSEMSFERDNEFSNLLDLDLLYKHLQDQNIECKYELIIIKEWPILYGIVYQKDSVEYIVPFLHRNEELKIANGEPIKVEELMNKYRKYWFNRNVSKTMTFAFIPGCTLFILVALIGYIVKVRKR